MSYKIIQDFKGVGAAHWFVENKINCSVVAVENPVFYYVVGGVEKIATIKCRVFENIRWLVSYFNDKKICLLSISITDDNKYTVRYDEINLEIENGN